MSNVEDERDDYVGYDPRRIPSIARELMIVAAQVVSHPVPVGDGAFVSGDSAEEWAKAINYVAGFIRGQNYSLSDLARAAGGLTPEDELSCLADEVRESVRLDDMHYHDVAMAAVEAARSVALSIPAVTHADSAARLGLLLLGLRYS